MQLKKENSRDRLYIHSLVYFLLATVAVTNKHSSTLKENEG